MPEEQLAPLPQWTREYVLSLLPQEFDWLDFKRSDWFTLDADCLDKLSRYLSAWANYEGGYLIVGIDAESGQLKADNGVDFVQKGGLKEWLEDKLPLLVEEPLGRIGVATIPDGQNPNRGIIVLHVPASDRAPHQARDHKFYTRVGSKLQPLPKRAILDVLNRQKHPRVRSTVLINLLEPDLNEGSALVWTATNESDVFCRYVGADIHIPIRVGRTFLYLPDYPLSTDDQGRTFWKIRLENTLNQPLFPKATVERRVKAMLVPPITDNSGEIIRDTIPQVFIRTYADGAPYRDEFFAPEDTFNLVRPEM
jgi:hypothetical protein